MSDTNALKRLRANRTLIGGFLLPVLAVIWSGLVALPCAAMALSGDMSPHAGASDAVAMVHGVHGVHGADHTQHHAGVSAEEPAHAGHCPYCPPDPATPGGSQTHATHAACSVQPNLLAGTQLGGVFTTPAIASAVESGCSPDAAPHARTLHRPSPASPPGKPVPLNLRHCVFLI